MTDDVHRARRTSAVFICSADDPPVPDTDSDCPNRDEHTPAPGGYTSWFEWAGRMTRTGHKQQRCPGCGLYKIWRP